MRNLKVVPDTPIISSLLDTDFYKLMMGQLVFHKHPDVQVRYTFKNRTKGTRLLDYIDLGELREQLEHVRTLRFDNSDAHYIRGTNEYGERMFKEPYIDFLLRLRLPEFQLDEGADGSLDLRFPGNWSETIYWEIPALAVVNELYFRARLNELSRFQRQAVRATGIQRLAEKIRLLKENPDMTFSEFGTRRRFSREWQASVIEAFCGELSKDQFRGTSNTLLAKEFGLLPMGTNAHELPMGYSGIYYQEDEAKPLVSQAKVLEDWENEYGLGVSIMLTDTYGSPFFYDHIVTPEQMARWKGCRQDSGIPEEYVDKVVERYRKLGIDPGGKLIVFSDGQDIPKAVALHKYCAGRIADTYGIGTNLTNDLGFKALSIVVKLSDSDGHQVSKLSDNVEKATGSPEAIARMKRLVGYDVKYAEECRY